MTKSFDNVLDGKNMTHTREHRSAATIALVIFLAAIAFTTGASAAEEATLAEIRAAIEEKGARWTAGETSVSKLSPEEKEMLCGLEIDPHSSDILGISPPALFRSFGPLPYGDFDWRNESGQNWITSVKNQGACGSCWAFASLGVIEAVINIENNNPYIDVDLAEQQLVSDCCIACGNCGGGYCSQALLYIMNDGVPDEVCFPYQAKNCNCTPCADWQDRAWSIEDAYWITDNSTAEYKGALHYYGPMIVALNSGDDFFSYTGGIYEPVLSDGWGADPNHAVVLVGYNDTGGYWIIKNSWGSDWGYDGYGYVLYGVLEQYDYALVVDNTTGPSPPAPVISSPTHPDEDHWYTNRSPIFNWTNPFDASGIACYSYALDHSATTVPNEACNTTENSTTYSNLTGDIWYFHVRAKNNVSNWGPADHYRVMLDATDPVIHSVYLNKSSVNASEPILVSVNVSDSGGGGNASGIANVTADGVELSQQGGNLWNGTITAVTPLGSHNVTVVVYDNATNAATNDSVQYTVVDLEPPEITDLIATPAFIKLSGYTRVSATVVDPQLNTVYLVVASDEGIALAFHNITETNVSTVYNGTWDATQLGVTNGTVTELPVTTKRETTLYSVDGYFQQNQTAPEENTTAVFFANYSLNAIYPYLGSAEPKEIEPGNSTFTPRNTNISTDPHGTVNVTTLVIESVAQFKLVQEPAPDGVYTSGIEANDTFGNDNTAYTGVTVDTTLPETTLTSGPTEGSILSTNDVTFAWSGSDNSTLVYQYQLDGSWSAWTSATSVAYNDLANDGYTFMVKAKDQAGNEDATPASRSFTVSVTKKGGGGGGGGGPTLDSDGDGYSDTLERLAGTDPNDPNDHPGEGTAPSGSTSSSSSSKPLLFPTAPKVQAPATTTVTPTPTPAAAQAPTPEEPGFEALGAITGLLLVAYLIVSMKRT